MCSAIMASITLALTLVILKFIATVIRSITTSIVLIWVLLGKRAQYVELFPVGTSIAVL